MAKIILGEIRQPSKHNVCSFTWAMSFDEDNEGSGYVLHLEKGHPMWEATLQAIAHFTPKWFRRAFFSSTLFEAGEERWKNDAHQIAVSDEDAMVLSPDLWNLCTGPDAWDDDFDCDIIDDFEEDE